MDRCAYGCGSAATFTFKNGVACCSDHRTKCPAIKQKTAWNRSLKLSSSHRRALSEAACGNPKVLAAAALGGRANSGRHARPLNEILIKGSSYTTSKLRKRCIRAGLLREECYVCSLGPVWNDKPLTLQLDHINGDRSDNRIENLRIICPNCHTQTPTYCSLNRKSRWASGQTRSTS